MISVAIALALILWVCLRRTGAATALCFLLVGFVWRLVGAAFIEYAGPIDSYEAEMMVGEDGAHIAAGPGRRGDHPQLEGRRRVHFLS